MATADWVSAIDNGDNIVQSNSAADWVYSVSGAAAAASSMSNLLQTAPGVAIPLNAEYAAMLAGKIIGDIAENREVKLGDVVSFLGAVVAVASAIGYTISPQGRIASMLLGLGKGITYFGFIAKMFSSKDAAASENISSSYLEARTPPRFDPLALDLGINGIETHGADSRILFDHNGDGIRTGTGWVGSDDGFLVLDRNSNGSIDSGAELFGVDTLLSDGTKGVDGFSALRDLDTNGDTTFSAADARFPEVRVWQDANQDGISQASELTSLAERGITSISLADTVINGGMAGIGNMEYSRASYTLANGTTRTVSALELADNPFYSEFLDSIPLTDLAMSLPNMRGSGRVRSLREGASLDAELATLLQAVGTGTRANLDTQLDQIIKSWAATSGFKNSLTRMAEVTGYVAAGGYVSITTFEDGAVPPELLAWAAEHYEWGPGTDFSLPASYRVSSRFVGETLGVLESFNGLNFLDFRATGIYRDGGNLIWGSSNGSGGGGGTGGGSGSVSTAPTLTVKLQEQTVGLLWESYRELRQSVHETLALQTYLKPYLDEITFLIDDSGVRFDFSAVNTMLETKRTVDFEGALLDLTELNALAGSLVGALGWDGLQRLENWLLSAQVTPEMLANVKRQTGYEILVGSAQGETLSLAGYGRRVVIGGAGNDSLNGGTYCDPLSGGDGNDTLTGQAGDDVLSGGNGADSLVGGDANDYLDGGAGNDTLLGGQGADTYRFGRGAGQDIINNTDSDGFGVFADSVQLEDGLVAEDVIFSRVVGDSLEIRIKGTNDRLTVSSYFQLDGAATYSVERIVFSDGTVLGPDAIKTIVLQPSARGDYLTGYTTGDEIHGGDGNDSMFGMAGDDSLYGEVGADTIQAGDGGDIVWGGVGNDTLYGGNGEDQLFGDQHSDTLYGDAGQDTLDGGSGNDVLSGGAGADTYVFGRGAGQDTIYNSDSDVLGVNPDRILIDAELTPADIVLTRSSPNADLLISIRGTDDRLLVASYFLQDGVSNSAVESIRFADGTEWDVGTVKAMVQGGTESNDALNGYAVGDALVGAEGNDTIFGMAGDDLLDGGNGADNVQGGDGNDTLGGGAGNDTLYGGNGNDLVQGGAHADTLYGDSGNDTMDGGAGGDLVIGGTGADTYLFGKGSGQDTISNYDTDVAGAAPDIVQLGAGLTAEDIVLTRSSPNADLILSIKGTDDRLVVWSYFQQDGASANAVESIRFADSTFWDLAAVKARVLAGTDGNDALNGYATNDTLAGGDGNDSLFGVAGDDLVEGGAGTDNVQGGDGNDVLRGGAGTDTLYGGIGQDLLFGNEHSDSLYGDAGGDTLDGGSGNDLLSGGAGADTYLFDRGAGQDTINNNDSDVFGTNIDTVLLAAGIAPANVTLTRLNPDLVISINGTDDSLRIQSYFMQDGASSYGLESIKFADGTNWNYASVLARLSSVAVPPNLTVAGTAASESLAGGQGNDSIYGWGGGDTLNGGAGNDSLDGGTGNDTYLFGRGSGKDTISSSDPTAGKLDSIQLASDVLVSDLVATRDTDALLLSIAGSSDSLRINNYFLSDGTAGYQIEEIRFADGTIWNVGSVKARVTIAGHDNDALYGYATADGLPGLSGDDLIYGKGGADTLDGGGGDDRLYGDDGDDLLMGAGQAERLYGGNGNDNLLGQDGDDFLYGDAGTDTLEGGAGNDSLDGGSGSDCYVFGRGSGRDTISAYDMTAGKLDFIRLGPDIALTDVVLTRDVDALVLSIQGTSDSLRVSNYFLGDATAGYQVDQIKFVDGTVWDVASVKARVTTSGNEIDALYGYATADALAGLGGDDTVYGKGGADTLDGGSGEDRLYGDDGDDLLLGGSQNDRVNGGNGNDKLMGQHGDDLLLGDAGADTLDGGAGNDSLDGGAGSDIYVFGRGSGKDTIGAYDVAAGKLDVIQMGSDVLVGDVSLLRDVDALVLAIKGTSDAIRVNNYFTNDAAAGYQVEQIKFADGTVWDVGSVKARATSGSADNDYLYGYGSADSLNALDGDDTVYARGGNDTLLGGAGEDKLYGEAGNDLLDGGIADDSLEGGAGNDTYQFGRGFGCDSISNYDSTGLENDKVLLGQGIGEDQIWFQRTGNDLLLTIFETDDKLTVRNWFNGSPYHLDSFELANGKRLLESQVSSLVSAMAAFAPPASGQSTLPANYQESLGTIIAASWVP